MSLIEEALRRAQEQERDVPAGHQDLPRPLSQQPVTATQEIPMSTTTVLQPSRSWIPLACLGGGFVLVIGVVIWKLWLASVPLAPASRRSVGTTRSASPQGAPTLLNPVLPHTSLLQPRLQLTGIVGGPGEPLAIINGNIMRVGETRDGALLLEVREDAVRVRWHDQELVLRITTR